MSVADVGCGHGAKFKVEALLSEHDVSPSRRMHRQNKGCGKLAVSHLMRALTRGLQAFGRFHKPPFARPQLLLKSGGHPAANACGFSSASGSLYSRLYSRLNLLLTDHWRGAFSAVQTRALEPERPEKGQKRAKNRGLPKAGALRKVC
ncbi:hypothetical protein [Pseudomonas sp. RGM 3321]|uniref:hypothetical protein n=1 Tax=Pseudomonas sp. RGM 3321 TaxID=2930089 RepID=UPI001FCB97BF|nr:hypothetical protein [Pseudomonas sp. RGM 3321]MCJ2371117.1 hypothetical protein [Pseudomonas sp. RGM 3321]